MLAMLVGLLSSTNLFAEDKWVDLEAEMFKSWSSPDADAVPTEETAVATDGELSCELKLFEQVGAGTVIYGHNNVYYLWYANVTGTKTIQFEGTAGIQLRVLMNRPVPVEGGDSHGGTTVERNVTIGDDGVATLDVSDLEYVHINAIKTGWGSPAGTLKKIQLYGTVKPVSGWVDMVNNGDLATDDLESFPVSKDGPNNGDTANDRPEIVDDGGDRVMKVTSDDLTASGDSWTTWSTQFYLKLNEFLPEGAQWRMEMDVKASSNANISTSAQGNPRAWHAGFVDAFDVYTDWNHFEWEGTVNADQAKDGGLGSIAFDLNNSASPIDFFFKNVHFYIYKEKSPLAQISAGFSYDVVCINFGSSTNLDQLVQAAGGKRVIFPNECASVKVNGEPTTLLSVEGKTGGRLFVFVDEGYSEDEADVVEVSFTNPTDEALHLKFIDGRWEGTDVPSFTDMLATYQYELGEEFSYLSDTPELVYADPEDGSFNLPLDKNVYTVRFSNNTDASQIEAYFDNTAMTVAPNEGFATEFTLTYNGTIEAGMHTVKITKIYPESPLADDIFGEEELTVSYGKTEYDPEDQPKDLLPVSYFNNCAANGIPEGYIVYFGSEERMAGNSYGSGARMFTFADGGEFTRGLYFRDQHVEYGSIGGYELNLEAGKAYTIHFNTAAWKDGGYNILFEIESSNGGDPIYSTLVTSTLNVDGGTGVVNGSTIFEEKFTPEETGSYIFKWYPADGSGNKSGWSESLLANVYVKYVPNVIGMEETQLLLSALETAKAALQGNTNERYDGADFNALQTLIQQVEAEMEGYTAPSVFKAMAAELAALTEAMNNHHVACDNYDANIKKAIDIRRQNAENKFAATDSYGELSAAVEKYHGTSTWVNVAAEGEDAVWQLSYTFDSLKVNSELEEANATLTPLIDFTGKMFTTGPSKCNMTGYAVLTERLRLGAEALKSLGEDENSEFVVRALNSLSDDDEIADLLKNRIKQILYGQLMDPENTLFAGTIDEVTLEEKTPTYDMTVFVKNPNIYKTKQTGTFSAENVPGWYVPEAPEGLTYKAPGVSTGWSNPGSDLIPVDGMFEGWHNNYRIETTIEDLPAGVYTIKGAFIDREYTDERNSFLYVKTSNTKGENGLTAPVSLTNVGQKYPTLSEEACLTITDVEVVDGRLTIGANAGIGEVTMETNTFFNEVQVLLTAPAAGFDYATAFAVGIESAEATAAKVRAIEIYDLNGRRVLTAPRGVCIVKKLMSDGTVKTEKVIRK
jgi:hypothetical protein